MVEKIWQVHLKMNQQPNNEIELNNENTKGKKQMEEEVLEMNEEETNIRTNRRTNNNRPNERTNNNEKEQTFANTGPPPTANKSFIQL